MTHGSGGGWRSDRTKCLSPEMALLQKVSGLKLQEAELGAGAKAKAQADVETDIAEERQGEAECVHPQMEWKTKGKCEKKLTFSGRSLLQAEFPASGKSIFSYLNEPAKPSLAA